MARSVFLAVWTTLLWLASGLEYQVPASSQSIDLLEAVGLYNNSLGINITQGNIKSRTAYLLEGDYRDLKLPPSAFRQVSDLLRRSPEFTIAAWLRQEKGNTGTIVSIYHDLQRLLELQSSGRKNEIRLHYMSKVDSLIHVETFPYKLADNEWHHVAVSVSGSQAELIVDCHPLYKRILKPGVPERNFNESHILWVGQRNTHYLFKGKMQEVLLIGGRHGYLSPCPLLDMSCPTCGQYSTLESTVQELRRNLQELSERLVAAEGRIHNLEDCDCQKSCREGQTIHADGATWQTGCDLCSCVHGEIKCHPVECPEVQCKHPVKLNEECCYSCLKHCFLNDQFFDHGEVVTVKKCVECECKDGSMDCNRINPETACPKLTCPPEAQFSVPDNCCKFCPDIDECQQEGGLGGHHCQKNTVCVNTPGSYKCECLEGYRSLDKFNCIEEDECSTRKHKCDENADCINTQGSYHCVCREGYQGDGYTCDAVCNDTCLNGGICSSPGKCRCPNGYMGPRCETDVDECKMNLHRCTETSDCVNMIGWYYCTCREGYRSKISNNNLGTLCEDINECLEGQHTCHRTATCVNTNGHYRCECSNSSVECRLNCMQNGMEVIDGTTIEMSAISSDERDKCKRCVCNRGVLDCEKPVCDCSVKDSDLDECCPQCSKKHRCKHQELSNVIFNHGEQWSYQCQTCECEYGEVDCWDIKCPPLLCENPITTSGDCCPHCGNPCPLGNVTGMGQQCVYMGRMYESGSQFADPNDTCVTCNCKDGALCCSYSNHCRDDEQPVGFDGLVGSTALPMDGGVTKTGLASPASLRVANTSDNFDLNDSVGGGKTEKTPPGG